MLLIAIAPLVVMPTFAQDRENDVNESPYFFIENENASTEHFPLLSTKVHAELVGPVANVVVEQVYKNDGKIPIEATYVFPASTRAAVYDMQMIIGGRTIRAEIQERGKAQKIYNSAKSKGKRAALLQQERANVFKMQVANIMPGDLVQVVLRYHEFLIPEDRIYTFIYPTVVGPRYVSKADQGSASFAANPYLQEDKTLPSFLDIDVQVRMAIPIGKISCTSHKVQIQFKNQNQAMAHLLPEDQYGGNRDFIFKYQISGDKIESGTWLYEHDDEKFFLTSIEPPESIADQDILAREYIFVIDVSGSMHGFPLTTSKELIRDLVSRLRSNDFFNVLLFAGDSKLLSEVSLSATEENLQRAFDLINQLDGRGGTELLPALTRIGQMPHARPKLSRSVVIITDGYISAEPEVFDLISRTLNDANVFAFGIGSSVNRLLIEGMAHVGRGEPFIVTKPEFAKEAADRFAKYIERPVLSNIEVHFGGFDVYEVVPSHIPDLMAERPIFIFGKFDGEAKGNIEIVGDQSHKTFSKNIEIRPQQYDSSHAAIRHLWAREKIRWNQDFNQLSSDPDRVEAITKLGIQYNLLTDYTSFVAVDETTVVNENGEIATVNQVLPLPENVSNYAIGFEMGAEGLSIANQMPDTILVVPMVVSELSPSQKTIVEKAFQEDMHRWGKSLQDFVGKKMEITMAEKMTDIKVHIDGEPVSEMRRRYTMLILLGMRWKLVAGEKLVIKFIPGMHINSHACG